MKSEISIKFKYEFSELSDEAKQNVFNHIRENWYDLGDVTVQEYIDSLKELAKQIDGHLDYSISQVPDRGEYIKLNDFNEHKLKQLEQNKDNCPLTGVYSDVYCIEALIDSDLEQLHKQIHEEVEYIYSDENLADMIEANNYEFDQDGNFI